MSPSETLSLIQNIITSIGGAFLVSLLCLPFLKEYLLNKIKHKDLVQHQQEIELLKLQHQIEIEQSKHELDLFKQKHLNTYQEKLNTFKEIILLVSEILRDLEAIEFGTTKLLEAESERTFSINRLKAYGLISLTSNQAVMDDYNILIDSILPVIYQKAPLNWSHMRTLADNLLNSMRIEIELNSEPITYRKIK